MSQFDGVLLVNQSLLAIGRSEISVEALQDDIFELDLTSIDRLMLLTKIEELCDQKIDISQLGGAPSLSVQNLVHALEMSQ